MFTDLPLALTRNLADSEVEVVSWSADADELVLRITKEVGHEQGLLRFTGVTRVELVPRLTLSALTVGGTAPDGAEVDPGETVFHLHETWGARYYVVAELLTYAVAA